MKLNLKLLTKKGRGCNLGPQPEIALEHSSITTQTIQHSLYMPALKFVCDFHHTKYNALFTPAAAHKNFRLSLYSTDLVYLLTISNDSHFLKSPPCYVDKQRTAEYSPSMRKRRETIDMKWHCLKP
jgi:hypothetical protein